MDSVKYPKIRVKLTGKNGNAFVALGVVRRAMEAGKIPQEEIAAFTKEATNSDYNHLLATCMKWVNVE